MISVVMATFNGEKYIKKQLKSIISQTKKVDEIIIVDDCSSDNTVKLIEQFKNKYNQNLKLYINKVNIGYRKNFKKAISLCESEYIFLCDQDDIWYPTKVEEMLKIMTANKSIGILSSSFDVIDANDQVISIKQKKHKSNNNLLGKFVEKNKVVPIKLEDIIFHNFCQGCSLLINKNNIKVFLDNYNCDIPHDWYINMIGALNNQLYFYNKPLFQYRLHQSNTIGFSNNLSLKQKFTLDTRIDVPKQILTFINCLKELDENYFERNVKIKEIYLFIEQHIIFMKKYQFFSILLQNVNPMYKNIKSKKGRLLDFIFCIKETIKKIFQKNNKIFIANDDKKQIEGQSNEIKKYRD